MSMFAAAAMALATAALALQTRVFPAWLAWSSAVAAIGGVLVIFLGLTSFLVLLWIVALSAYLVLPQQAIAPPPG